MAHHEVPTAETVVDGLGMDPSQWQSRISRVERTARGPDGDEATLVDNVIVLRRISGIG
jgi:hypothetical protein